MSKRAHLAAMLCAGAFFAMAGGALAGSPMDPTCARDCQVLTDAELSEKLDAARKEGASHYLLVAPDANYPSMARVANMARCKESAKNQPAGTLCIAADASQMWRKP